MVVAHGTLGGEAEETASDCVGAVEYVVESEFFVDGAAFGGHLMVASECCGEDLFLCGVGDEVAGELLSDELVVGHVVAESVDDPVAPGPHESPAIGVHAV